MSHDAILEAVENRFRTQWSSDATNCRTPIAFENVSGLTTTVAGGIGYMEPKGLTQWVRLSVHESLATSLEINPASRVRIEGDLQLQIFVELGVGQNGLRELADLAIPIFEGRQFSGVSVWEGMYFPVGKTEGWFQANVSWPFYYDRIMDVA